MPTYKVTDPSSGKTLSLTGDSPPTEQELEQVFKSVGGESQELKKEELPQKKEKPNPINWVGRTLSNIPGNALDIVKGLGSMVANPGETVSALNEATKTKGLQQILGKPIETLVKDPLGAPGRVADYVEKHPVDVALAASPLAKGKILEQVGKVAKTTLPEKVYGSAVKVPLDPLSIKSMGPEAAIEQRMNVLNEGVKNRLRRNEAGLVEATAMEEKSRQAVEDVITKAMKSGAPKIKTSEILDAGLQNAYEVAATSSDPVGAKKVVDKIKSRFESHGEFISVEQANEVKRQLYKETSWTSKSPTGLSAQLSVASKKGVGHELMAELERRYPVLDVLNADDATKIQLRNAIEKSMKSGENFPKVAVGMHPAGGGMFLRAWESTAGHPWIKESLAFALDKARSVAKILTPEKPGFTPWTPPPPKPRQLTAGSRETAVGEVSDILHGRTPRIGPRLLSEGTPGSFTHRSDPGLPPKTEGVFYTTPGGKVIGPPETRTPQKAEAILRKGYEVGVAPKAAEVYHTGPNGELIPYSLPKRETLKEASVVGGQKSALQIALEKPAFARTSEDRMVLMEAGRAQVTPTSPIEVISALTPKSTTSWVGPWKSERGTQFPQVLDPLKRPSQGGPQIIGSQPPSSLAQKLASDQEVALTVRIKNALDTPAVMRNAEQKLIVDQYGKGAYSKAPGTGQTEAQVAAAIEEEAKKHKGRIIEGSK